MIDTVLLGFDESKAVWVISDAYKDIGEAINSRLGRGVTYLKGEGAYTGEDKRVIFCVITRLEEAKLKDIVMEIDEKPSSQSVTFQKYAVETIVKEIFISDVILVPLFRMHDVVV